MNQLTNNGDFGYAYQQPMLTMGALPPFIEKNKFYLVVGIGALAVGYILFLKTKIGWHRRRARKLKRKLIKSKSRKGITA